MRSLDGAKLSRSSTLSLVMAGSRAFWVVVALAALAGLLLHAPSLGAGYAGDDYLQLAMLDGDYPVRRSSADLYCFARQGADERNALVRSGALPWWSDSDYRACALRPLSSWLMAFEHRYLRLGPMARHAHSLLWLAAAVVALALWLREHLPAPAVALAALIFAVDPAHVLPAGWLANRAALAGVTLALFALRAHDRWRRGSAPAVYPLVLWTLSLLAGEYALSAVAYAVGWTCFVERGPLGKRAQSLALALAPAAAYTTAHVALGYGARGSSIYLDPIGTPSSFLSATPARLSSLLAEEAWLVPSSWVGARATALLAVFAVLFAVWLVPLVVRTAASERRVLLALLAGAALSTLPMLAPAPHSRLLVVPSIGTSALIAVAIREAWTRLRGGHRELRSLAALAMGVLHVAVAPLLTANGALLWRSFTRQTHEQLAWPGQSARRAATANETGAASRADQRGVLLTTNHVGAIVYPPYAWRAEGTTSLSGWYVLATASGRVHAVRPDPFTLEITAVDGALLADTAALLFRRAPFITGERVLLQGLEVTVVEARKGVALAVRARFDTALEQAKVAFLKEVDGRFQPLELPQVRSAVPPDRVAK